MRATAVCAVLAVCTVTWVVAGHAPCSPVYGGEACSFLPAPPKHAPPCAKPGYTFCEYPGHYPMHQIKYLIRKWSFDHQTLITDESKEEYSTYFVQPDYGYGPSLSNHNSNYNGPDSVFITKPPDNSGPYSYQPPSHEQRFNFSNGGAFAPYPERRPTQAESYSLPEKLRFQSNFNNYNNYPQSSYQPPPPPPVMQFSSFNSNNNNNWWTRYKRDTGDNSTQALKRSKRQGVTPLGQTLCPTRSRFITPRAALNNQGNWMYVVNVEEVDGKYTQLVKSDICVSQQCNGLCSLPNGYRSRCEQKYVQKRLVALEGGGQRLYTDVFWFPSCCICTIYPN